MVLFCIKKTNKKSFAIYDHKLHKTRPPSCEKSHRILIIHNQRCRFIPSCVREDDPPRNKLLLTSPNGVHWPTPRETRYESGAQCVIITPYNVSSHVTLGLDRPGANPVYFFSFNIVEMKNYMLSIFLRFDIWFTQVMLIVLCWAWYWEFIISISIISNIEGTTAFVIMPWCYFFKMARWSRSFLDYIYLLEKNLCIKIRENRKFFLT